MANDRPKRGADVYRVDYSAKSMGAPKRKAPDDHGEVGRAEEKGNKRRKVNKTEDDEEFDSDDSTEEPKSEKRKGKKTKKKVATDKRRKKQSDNSEQQEAADNSGQSNDHEDAGSQQRSGAEGQEAQQLAEQNLEAQHQRLRDIEQRNDEQQNGQRSHYQTSTQIVVSPVPRPSTAAPTQANNGERRDATVETGRHAPNSLLAQLEAQQVSGYLLDYVAWVMDQRNFPQVNLADRERMLRRLIGKHGDGHEWRDAAPFTFYVEGELNLGDDWPLLQDEFDDVWRRTRGELQHAKVQVQNDAEFENLRTRCLRQQLLFLPPKRQEDQTADAYVTDTVRKEYIDRATTEFRPRWDTAFDSGDELFDEEARGTYDNIFNNDDDLAFPYGPEEYLWSRRWSARRAEMQTRQVDANALGRFEDAFDLAEEEYRVYGNFIMPVDLPTNMETTDFLAELRQKVKSEIAENLRRSWDEAFKRVRSGREYDDLYYDHRTMLNEAYALRPTWRPIQRLGYPSRITTRAQQAQTLAPGTDRSSIEGFWNFKRVLGVGGHGHASLWVKEDSLARIVDRLVTKDTEAPGRLWDNAMLWHGNINLRIPKEYELNRRLKTCRDSDHIIHVENTYAIYEKTEIYRLYFEFCQHGSLQDLIERHRSLKQRDRVDQHGDPFSFRIPTRALWAIFEALVSAACLLRDGHLPSHDAPAIAADHSSILHLDLKPDNVFLNAPDKELWPGIPVAKLADFGVARFQSDEDAQYGDGVGTRGWQAPESVEYRKANEWYHKVKQSSYSNVWCIGRIMLSLMNLVESDPKYGAILPMFSLESQEKVPTDFADSKDRYPESLRKLLEQCLQREPNDRIEVDQLWREIQSRVASFEGLRGLPMKMRKGDPDELLDYKPDMYALWSRAP